MRNFAAPLCLLVSLAACDGASPAPRTATEAAAATATPAPSPTREEDIRRYLLQTYPDAAPLRYAFAWSDLDGDGVEEAIVHLASPYFCGSGGCNTLVLTPAGPMWRAVGEISVSRTPVSVLGSKTNGWRDLTVDIGGGGGGAGIALLKFDGQSYPANPTVPPAESAEGHGDILIAEDPVLIEAAALPSGE